MANCSRHQFLNDENTDGSRNVGSLAVNHLTQLLARQSFIELNTVRSAFIHLSLCTIHFILPKPCCLYRTLNYLSNAVLLEKLILAQLLKKLPTLYETRKFIPVSTRTRLGFLSLATLVLYSSLCLALPSRFMMKILYVILIPLTRALCGVRLNLPRLDKSNNVSCWFHTIKLGIFNFLNLPTTSCLVYPDNICSKITPIIFNSCRYVNYF
jgi:hypothetical protein